MARADAASPPDAGSHFLYPRLSEAIPKRKKSPAGLSANGARWMGRVEVCKGDRDEALIQVRRQLCGELSTSGSGTSTVHSPFPQGSELGLEFVCG